MVTLQECIDIADLTEEEALELARASRLPTIVAVSFVEFRRWAKESAAASNSRKEDAGDRERPHSVTGE